MSILTTRWVTGAGISWFAAVRDATLIDSSGWLLTIGCPCGTHGTVSAIVMVRYGAGGGTTAGVMRQMTERGGTTVFAWAQTDR